MKIHVLSDLHLEFAAFKPPETDADIVVLAGDTDLGIRGIEWAKQVFLDKRVVYVAGNHEFYKHHWVKLLVELRAAAAGSNVIFLENDELTVQGVRFLGASLWTDFELFGDDQRHPAMVEAEREMNDYRKIRAPRVRPGFRDNYSKLKPIQTVERFRRSKLFLEAKANENFDGPTVVVTHHLPLPSSVPERYAQSLVSASYASDVHALVAHVDPDLWVHGHVHDSFDYQVGRTRVLCNPRGYSIKGEENALFDPKLVISV